MSEDERDILLLESSIGDEFESPDDILAELSLPEESKE